MVAQPVPTPEKSPVSEAAEYARVLVKQHLALEGSVQLGTVSEEMVQHFSMVPGYAERLMEDVFKPVLYDIASRTVAATRGNVVFGDQVMPQAMAVTQIRQRARFNSWSSWLEHVESRHMPLMQMTADELLTAAAERRTRGTRELKYATLWEQMAAQLTPLQTVKDVFDDRAITKLASRLNITVDVIVDIMPDDPPDDVDQPDDSDPTPDQT